MPMKKKKSHADLMAEIAAEEAAAAKGRKLKKKEEGGGGSQPSSPTRRSAPPPSPSGKKSHAEIMSEIHAVSAFDNERKEEIRRKAPKHSAIQAHRTPHVARNMGDALGGFTASEETHLDGWESPRTAKKHANKKLSKETQAYKLASKIVKKDRFGRVLNPKKEEVKKEGNSATKLMTRFKSKETFKDDGTHSHDTDQTQIHATTEMPQWKKDMLARKAAVKSGGGGGDEPLDAPAAAAATAADSAVTAAGEANHTKHDCKICGDDATDEATNIVLKCGHYYHRLCLSTHGDTHNCYCKCPGNGIEEVLLELRKA